MKSILLFILGLILWGCQTSPPVSSDSGITIVGNDSTVIVKYSPQLSGINKTVLIEDFANVSCVPCVISNKTIESLTNYTFGHSSVAAVKYAANFPSPSDPFYLANPSVCSTRMSYYNIFTAPTNIIDGILKPDPTDSNDVISKITQRLQVPSKLKITVNDSISADDYFIRFSIEVRDTTNLNFNNLICNIVVTETDIQFTTPPGSNGETEFYDVMRVMFPTGAQQIQLNTNQSTSVMNLRQLKINSNWNKQKLHTVIFIQDKSTKEVIQSASTYNK
ncbi:MAG: hypothetical protein P4L35_09130 [Ignavibacteriaceae bacterium]|nr:hypothetical protein [Ignavibacteriaceae bacterium]